MLGNILGAFEAAMLLRGMRTLYVRVRHQCAVAMTIARHFAGHPAIADVFYPGLATHPGHAVAARQMHGGFGGMLAMRFNGGQTLPSPAPQTCRYGSGRRCSAGLKAWLSIAPAWKAP